MFDVIGYLAEERIKEAMERGEFDNLRGAGEPLTLEDESHVPPELRLAYRILKRSGHAPPELEEEKEIANLRQALASESDEERKLAQIQKLNVLVTRLNVRRRRPVNLEAQEVYYEKIVEKTELARDAQPDPRSEGGGES